MDHDTTIQVLAARQHGVVARGQLLAAGVPAHAIERRIRRQRLQPLHRAVYRLGPVRSPWEAEMAAALACGTHAVVSHHSAAALWELTPRRDGPVHVSVAADDAVRVRGVRVHRVSALHALERAMVDGIPCTSCARTLLDVAAHLSDLDLERMLATAERQQLMRVADVEQLIALRPNRRGVDRVRNLLGRIEQPALTRSEAEARFLSLIRKAELRVPVANAKVRGLEVDFLWRAERLVVEVDGVAFHSSTRAFERDRERDAVLLAAGLRIMRVTWRQLTEKPEAVVGRVAQALARSTSSA